MKRVQWIEVTWSTALAVMATPSEEGLAADVQRFLENEKVDPDLDVSVRPLIPMSYEAGGEQVMFADLGPGKVETVGAHSRLALTALVTACLVLVAIGLIVWWPK